MDVVTLGILAIGLVSGAAIGFLLARLTSNSRALSGKVEKLEMTLEIEEERSAKYQQDVITLNDELRQDRERLIAVNNDKASLESINTTLKERLNEQKSEITELQERFAAQFKNLANEIFEEKSKKFTDQNKVNLDTLLKPLGQKLADFERKVEETNKDSLQRSAALREQILSLKELNQRMTNEAENLTKALKGDSRIQGNWGELILERILEQSGLQKDREYFTQESIRTEAGRRLRPDVIIRMPDNKNLVVDAKASLVSYEKYVNADSDEEREQYLKEHLVSVKTHIRGLANKNYNQLFDTGSLDYVLMFVPIEAAFALIIERGGELYNEAHNQNIVIVSPATLIATLRTVASIWKHEYQNKNALEIARQGGALYDKFKAFVDDLIKVGQSLASTKGTYDEAMKKLTSGKDNLIRKTERLRELGAKSSKTMDPKILNRADVPEPRESLESRPPLPQQNLFGGE
ncbi:MAG: DNA recombination protein RmuC [Bacteroidota bacterium]